MDLLTLLSSSCGIFLLENLLSQQNNVQHHEEGGEHAKAHNGLANALGADANQQEEGEAEQNCPRLVINKVIAGLGFKHGVQLAEQNGAGGGGAGLHTVDGEEGLVLIIGEHSLADIAMVNIGADGAEDADNGKGNDEAGGGEGVQVDGGDGRDNHDVEHKAGDAVEHEVVGIVALHNAALTQLGQHHLNQHTENGGEEELEAPNHALDSAAETAEYAGLDEAVNALHEEEGHNVCNENKGHLNGELVHALAEGDFVLACVLIEGHFVVGVLAGGAGDNALFAEIAKSDNAADGGGHEAHGCNGKTEGSAVFEAVAILEGVTPGVSLSGTLTIAKGEQNAGGDEAAYGVEKDDSHNKTDDCLQEVSVNNCQTGIHSAGFGALIGLLINGTQRHGGEAEAETVISEYLKYAIFVKRRVENVFAESVDDEQDKATQNG